jgi:3-oxoacyl-[acyl-carrier-protein] synthase-3
MGVVVRSTAIVRPTRWPMTHGARRLADAAVHRCLAGAERSSRDIELLVNVGVYRERGLGEPALAALIQDDVKANPGDVSTNGHGTFSFDVDNGACGVLTAADLMSGLLASGTIATGLVVASDSASGPLHVRDFPYAEAGGALLLAHDESSEGLGRVRLDTFPEFADLVQGHWEWQAGASLGHPHAGRNRLVVREGAGFGERAAECASDSVHQLLRDENLSASDVDLLLATPGDAFADSLADLVGIGRDQTLHLGERVSRFHTAQPIAAIDSARRAGRWEPARTVLLVSAGAGITVASALYRH